MPCHFTYQALGGPPRGLVVVFGPTAWPPNQIAAPTAWPERVNETYSSPCTLTVNARRTFQHDHPPLSYLLRRSYPAATSVPFQTPFFPSPNKSAARRNINTRLETLFFHLARVAQPPLLEPCPVPFYCLAFR
ncbi:hypothetical protein BS50DRAFT_574393 [Corynespora cassiicola Philippines]|uniref:Uncharacterized protein n=1 Tax=Corynespora cassiicola Philippines TaxID=1448308 RepID=A0A2T2NKE3_CORCC|nr:hypothetical protein BS50DRAFT_574393 [Corynespora cassiicola Philippines]